MKVTVDLKNIIEKEVSESLDQYLYGLRQQAIERVDAVLEKVKERKAKEVTETILSELKKKGIVHD